METDRLRKSIKIEFEHKFIKQKAELLDILDKKLSSIKEKLAIQIQEENNNIIQQNIKLLSLEKKNAEKNDILIDQELLLRHQAILTEQSFQFEVSKQYNVIQQIVQKDQNDMDASELKFQIEELKTRNLKLSLKFSKLLSYFVDLQLYDNEFAKQAAFEEFPFDELYKPQLPQTHHQIEIIELNHQKYQSIIKEKKQQLEIDLLLQQNKKLKKQLFFQDLSTDVKGDQQQKKTLFSLGEQTEDLKNLDKILQPIQHTQPKCKTLNDIILKKRKQSYDSGEPIFDFYKLSRNLIAERLLQQQPIQFLYHQKCRFQSQLKKK